MRLDQVRGRVVLLNLWVFTCGNCTRTVPSLVGFDRRYRQLGLTIIGIHTPDFPPYAGAAAIGPALAFPVGLLRTPGLLLSPEAINLWLNERATLRVDDRTGSRQS